MGVINAASSCAPSDSESSMPTAETELIASEFLDIFSVAFRILVAAKHRDIDLKEVLSYELCSVPIALAHPDGTL